MNDAEFPAAVAAIAALGDPTRRALYRYIAAQGMPVGREDAAAAVGVPHHVARFHRSTRCPRSCPRWSAG